MLGSGALALASAAFAPSLGAQATPPTGPTIDTVVIHRANVFDEDVAEGNFLFRAMNALHVRTRPRVIRRELLLGPGDAYDSLLVAESARLLRQRQLFRDVAVDTARVDGGLALVVDARDGWSTKPKFKFTVATDGTWTGTIGLNEINLLGTGNQVYAAYTKDVDREGLNASLGLKRLLGELLDAELNYAGLSDGDDANWQVGEPWRATTSPWSATYDGLTADQRILQYRVSGPATLDTTVYRRTATETKVEGGVRLSATPSGYTRVGGSISLRSEEYVLELDSIGDVPDTTSLTVGGWIEWRRSGFETMRYFNGFGLEDVDLSGTMKVGVNLTPKALGWPEDGVAPSVNASYTINLPRGFIWSALDANARFTDAGLDSGRVVVNVGAGFRPWPRHSTTLQVQGGLLENTAPGSEFDLGFENAPRSWGPHAFVGDRTVWGTLEHRWYLWDKVLNLVGLGVAGFVDYGGAWYQDQEPRFGGNVGVGLRTGSALTTVPTTARLDLGYRIGDDVTGTRWSFVAGAGFVFPRRTIPVVNYRARPPP